ncbi:MAG TPA: DUF5996 family protein [bacterium]|nr:DUF5996 family protein [bacterium]
MSTYEPWPGLGYEEWSDTLETLHLWTQIVGKIRLVSTPWTNHSWHCTLYVTPHGLTTSTICQGSRQFDIEFDLHGHVLVVRTGEGQRRTVSLEPRTVASFYEELMGHLRELGFPVKIYVVPNEVLEPIPFPEDTVHQAYDPDAVARFAQVLSQSARVFTQFRSGFTGKCSPVHFFWGSFDLAVTRFSGRRAPMHPGGIPGLPDWVTREAYSHEVYSCGFWPGGVSSPAPAYYAYAYPVPEGLGESPVGPPQAFWSSDMGEFFLPYEAVRTAGDPDAALMEFIRGTYLAAADLGSWSRSELETPVGFPHRIR